MKSRGWLVSLLMLMAAALSASQAQAHEVRPAFLQITQNVDGKIDVLFKQPSTTTMAVRLEPEISGGLLNAPPALIDAGSGYQIRQWRGLNGGAQGLGSRRVTVHGLERSITDALLVVYYADGHELQQLLTPEKETLDLDVRGDGLPVATYLKLGVTHILTGYDHLLFVLGLVLLVRGVKTLVKTISAFTVAHSITLAATALGFMHVRPAQIEALVALSILFVAVELANAYRGRSSITQRWPWVIAFSFGLLHGSAFAGALAEIGLPRDNIPLALFLFNAGVEIGQLFFVFVVLAVLFAAKRAPWPRVPAFGPAPRPVLAQAPTYAIGISASFWFFERFHAAIF